MEKRPHTMKTTLRKAAFGLAASAGLVALPAVPLVPAFATETVTEDQQDQNPDQGNTDQENNQGNPDQQNERQNPNGDNLLPDQPQDTEVVPNQDNPQEELIEPAPVEQAPVQEDPVQEVPYQQATQAPAVPAQPTTQPTASDESSKPSFTVELKTRHEDTNKNGFAEAGEKIFYTVELKNTGKAQLYNVELSGEHTVTGTTLWAWDKQGEPATPFTPGATVAYPAGGEGSYTVTPEDVRAGKPLKLQVTATAYAQDRQQKSTQSASKEFQLAAPVSTSTTKQTAKAPAPSPTATPSADAEPAEESSGLGALAAGAAAVAGVGAAAGAGAYVMKRRREAEDAHSPVYVDPRGDDGPDAEPWEQEPDHDEPVTHEYDDASAPSPSSSEDATTLLPAPQPASDQPASGQQASGQPTTEQPAAERPGHGRRAAQPNQSDLATEIFNLRDDDRR